MNHFPKFSVFRNTSCAFRAFASTNCIRGVRRNEVAKSGGRLFKNMPDILRTFTNKSCPKGGGGKGGGSKGDKDGGKDANKNIGISVPPKPKKRPRKENSSCRRGPNMSHFQAAKWKKISFGVIPAILLLTIITFATMRHHERPEFVPYPYMRKRDKKFFWGDGNHTFFHNKHVNALPEGYEDE